jgi:hypothetical protein
LIEQTDEVEVECVEAVAESPAATADVPEAPPQPEVVPDGTEPGIPDAREEIPVAPSLADLQESSFELVEGNPVEVEGSSAVAFETEKPVPPPQSPPEPEATASETGPEDAEEASSDFVATPVLEGEVIEATPSETDPVDGGEADKKTPPKEPVLEGEDMDLEGLGMVLGEENDK